MAAGPVSDRLAWALGPMRGKTTVDASVRFLAEDTNLELLKLLATRDDGNPLEKF